MFTRNQIEEIKKKLVAFGTKDTQLLDAHKLDGNEIVAIVQDGENRKIPLSSIIGLLSNISVTPNDDFINVSKDTTEIITLNTAVSKVVINNRKLGQIITFKDSANSWAIRQFTGDSLDNWNDISLWKSISGIDELKSQVETNAEDISVLNDEIERHDASILHLNTDVSKLKDKDIEISSSLSGLTTEVNTLKSQVDIDEEDITRNTEGKLQFKDRPYGDGMGYVILRKNKSFAEQITKENTIYEIRYEFDLGGVEVVIPKDCILDFQGGSLSNGTINGNLTIIQGNTFGIFDSIVILGEWNVRNISSNMFKTLREENSIKNVFNLSNSNVTNKIVIENNGYDYLVTNTNPINLTSNSDIEINGTIKIVPNSASSYIFFNGQNVSNINIYGCGKFIGDRDEHSYIGETTHEWGYGFQFTDNVDNIRISGLFFTDFTGGSIRFNDKASNIKIENVTTERNRTGGIEFTGGAENIIISNCNFKDVGIDTEHSTYTNPGDSIGIEPNYHIGLDNINIENCKFINCRLPIYITNNYEMGGSYSVRGCIIEGGPSDAASILFGNMKFITIENCRISDRSGLLECNNDYKNLSIKNNYITSKAGILYYDKVPTGFSNIENNQFEDEGSFSIKGLKNCNFINNSLKTNGAFVQDSQSSVINFINNKIDGLFCYNGYRMVLNDSIITGNTFIQPTSQNAIWFSGENIKIKSNNFITNKELESSRACLYLTDASNIVISENLFSTKINSMNYYIMSSNSNNIYLLNNIFSEKEVNDRYTAGDGIVFIKDGEYRTGGASNERPIIPIDKHLIGKLYFDTTLNKPIWWTGSKWVDAIGADA